MGNKSSESKEMNHLKTGIDGTSILNLYLIFEFGGLYEYDHRIDDCFNEATEVVRS